MGQQALPPASLQSIFRLDDPYSLLAAAIFGLAPNVLIRNLQQKVEGYTTALKSSKSSAQESKGGGK